MQSRNDAKAVGAKVAVDNTFLSPALQRPITMGADFVIHSTTKYLNGHSDVVGGAVIAAEKSRRGNSLQLGEHHRRDRIAFRFLPDATRLAHFVPADGAPTGYRRRRG